MLDGNLLAVVGCPEGVDVVALVTESRATIPDDPTHDLDHRKRARAGSRPSRSVEAGRCRVGTWWRHAPLGMHQRPPGALSGGGQSAEVTIPCAMRSTRRGAAARGRDPCHPHPRKQSDSSQRTIQATRLTDSDSVQARAHKLDIPSFPKLPGITFSDAGFGSI